MRRGKICGKVLLIGNAYLPSTRGSLFISLQVFNRRPGDDTFALSSVQTAALYSELVISSCVPFAVRSRSTRLNKRERRRDGACQRAIERLSERDLT